MVNATLATPAKRAETGRRLGCWNPLIFEPDGKDERIDRRISKFNVFRPDSAPPSVSNAWVELESGLRSAHYASLSP